MKVLAYVLSVIAVIVVSILLWVICISIAWKTGGWVGASTPIPREAQTTAFFPTIFNVVVGFICIVFASLRRKGVFIAAAITSFVMAAVLFLITGWFLAMGNIT